MYQKIFFEKDNYYFTAYILYYSDLVGFMLFCKYLYILCKKIQLIFEKIAGPVQFYDIDYEFNNEYNQIDAEDSKKHTISTVPQT